MDRVDVSGVRIAFRTDGPESGHPGTTVLMTHGFAASAHMFEPNAVTLAARHRVITWDLRGHGHSDAPTDPAAYSGDLAVADMLALLDHLEVERAVLAGHSLGGFLSLQFNLAHPDRVAGLVLIDTGPGYRDAEARARWNTMANRFALVLDDRGFDGLSVGGEFDPSVHRNGPHGLALAARGTLTQHDASVIESLPGLAVPTLVIVGERDQRFLNGSQYMAAKIEGAQLAVIEGAGHAPNVSHPDEFDAVVSQFLDRVANQSRAGQLDVR